MRRIWLGFFISLFAAQAHGNTKVMVRPTRGLESLPAELARHVERVALQVISARPGLELLLAGGEVPKSSNVDIWIVESSVTKKDERYELSAKLIDVREQKILRNIHLPAVPEVDVVRLFQGGIEALFEKPLPKRVSPPASGAVFENDQSAAALKKPQKKNTLVKSLPSASSIDFMERIKALQTEVDQKLVAVNEAREKEREARSSLSASGSGEFQTIQSESDDPLGQPKKLPWLVSSFAADLSYDLTTVATSGYARIEGQAHLLSAQGIGRLSRAFGAWSAGLKLRAQLSRAVVVPIPIETPYVLGLGVEGRRRDAWVSFSLARERIFFFGLENFGAGKSSGSLNTNFFEIAGGQCWQRWSRPLCFQLSYGVVLGAASEFEAASGASDWSGNKLNLAFSLPFGWKDWNVKINWKSEKISSSPVELEFLGERQFQLVNSSYGMSFTRSW